MLPSDIGQNQKFNFRVSNLVCLFEDMTNKSAFSDYFLPYLSQPSAKFFIILKRVAGNAKIGLMMIIMHIMNLNTCAITGRAHSLSLEQNSANKKAKSIHSF